MRAWQVQAHGEPVDVLRKVTIDAPKPGPGQLTIRVTAAGIGLPDVLMCRGTYPLTPSLPFTPGQEAVGIVTAVGADVDVPVGTRVMVVTDFAHGHGSFAEESLVTAESAFSVPDGLSDTAAAGFWIPHLTGWIGLVERGHLASGEWLAVLGAAGGSGIAAVQLGRALGARVIAVVSDEERADFCRQLGADIALRHGGGRLGRALYEITGGSGVDVVYDPVGGALAVDAASALKRDGRFLAVGFASGSWPDIEVQRLVIANASLVGVFAGGYSRPEVERIHAQLSALVGQGRLRNAVTATFAFDELPGAVQALADHTVVGKRVVDGPTLTVHRGGMLA
jgi:NADPH2:quinone reductase